MKYVYLIFFVSICYSQTRDTVITSSKIPKTYYETTITKTITITNTIVKIDSNYTESEVSKAILERDKYWKSTIDTMLYYINKAVEDIVKRK